MSERFDLPPNSVSASDPHRQLVPSTALSAAALRMKLGLRDGGSRDQAMKASFVWATVRRWRKVIVPSSLILAILGILLAHVLSQPEYEAAAWLRIEEKTPFLAFESRNDDRSRAFFQTQVELIRSPLVLGLAAKQPEMVDLPGLANSADKIGWLSKRIQVSQIGESELFKIHSSSSDPNRAASVVNAVTNAYFRLREQNDAGRMQCVLDLLHQEKANRANEALQLRKDLEELAKHTTGRTPVSTKTTADANVGQPLADLQNRLIMAQVDRAVLDAKLKAAEIATLAPTENGAGGRTGATARQRREDLAPHEIALRDALVASRIEEWPEVKQQATMILDQEGKLREIENVAALGARDPDYLRVQADIARAQQVLDRLRKEVRPRVEKEIEVAMIAKRTEADAAMATRRSEEIVGMRSELHGREILERRIDEEYQKALKEAKKTSGDTLLLEFKSEELSRAEKILELISQRMSQLQTERGAPARINLLMLAEAPTEPTSNGQRNMLLAALAGLCLPLLAAIGWERVMRRVGGLDDLPRQPSLPVLSEVAKLPLGNRRIHGRAANFMRPGFHLFEESIDSLRTRLTLCESLQDMRILAVTSAVNHEGKTSVACQLAISLARASSEPVLLVDGDMRSPDVHRYFGIASEPGLAAVLRNECALDQAIVASADHPVHVLPAGRLRASPYRLLANGTWKSLLEKISVEYRYVIIDTPPILAASEALVLATAADASIVCTMRDVSRVDQVSESCERLVAAGGRPVGMVLNGVPGSQYVARYGRYDYSNA
jgi:polysaccharide biosynthesis transport protein